MQAQQAVCSSRAQQHRAVCPGSSSRRPIRTSLGCSRALVGKVLSPVEGQDNTDQTHGGVSQEQAPVVCNLHAEPPPQIIANDVQLLEAPPAQRCSNEVEQQPEQPKQQGIVPYSFYLNHPTQPIPVQLPPLDASPDPSLAKPFFVRSAYRPPRFLQHYPGPAKGAPHNFISFLGSADPNGGKFLVPQQKLEKFLESYFNTMHHSNRRMHLAECYNDHPYKYFQELDFPWSLDINIVLALVPKVVQIVTAETCRVHKHTGPVPDPVISMRTPYKVHLNYPDIITAEAVSSSLVRKAVINRCRVELSRQPELQLLKEEQQLQEQLQEAQQLMQQLSGVVEQLQAAGFVPGSLVQDLMRENKPADAAQQPSPPQKPHQQPAASAGRAAASTISHSDSLAAGAPDAVPGAAGLDWESIIDFPHGSLRMIGSCKAPWMDSDPAWVQEKSYSRVDYVVGAWMRRPLTLASIQQCSILLKGMEQMLYEQSDDFLDASYQAVTQRQQLTQIKSSLRRAIKCLALLQELLTAVQENNTEAVTVLQDKAHKNYMIVHPDKGQQLQDVQPREQQQRVDSQRPFRKPKGRHISQQKPAETVEIRQKQRQALETLKRLQAGGTVESPAQVAAAPKLVRPLEGSSFGNLNQS